MRSVGVVLKLGLVILVVLVGLIIAAVLLDDGVPNLTGGELSKLCAENNTGCSSFVITVFSRGKDVRGPGAPYRRQWPGSSVACIQDEPFDHVMEVVIKSLPEHRSKWHVPAETLVVHIFEKSWPCP